MEKNETFNLKPIVISADLSYKIFTEGLEHTGIKDTLQLISFPYGKTIARTRFTILAVADTIYHRYGIFNIGDLIKWCGASPESFQYFSQIGRK